MINELIEIIDASDGDYEFSYQVKEAAEGDLIRKTFGWDEALQIDFHKKEWMKKRPSIIKLNGKSIGTISIIEGNGYLELGQFFIIPEYQNKGIGSLLICRVLKGADEKNKTVKLAFLKGNRAEELYKRNGFVFVEQIKTHIYMEWKPQKQNQ